MDRRRKQEPGFKTEIAASPATRALWEMHAIRADPGGQSAVGADKEQQTLAMSEPRQTAALLKRPLGAKRPINDAAPPGQALDNYRWIWGPGRIGKKEQAGPRLPKAPPGA
jgi:hypothetical protein